MKKVFMQFLFALILLACGKQKSIRVKVDGLDLDNIKIETIDTSIIIKGNDKGEFVLPLLDNIKCDYADLVCGNKSFRIFIEKDCDIYINDNNINFSGAGAAVNDYIKNIGVTPLDMKWGEAELMQNVKDLYTTRIKFLRSQNFSEAFINNETIRLKYLNVNDILKYRYCHGRAINDKNYYAKDNYYGYVKSFIVDNKKYIRIFEYNNSIGELVKVVALYRTSSYDDLYIVNRLIDYVINNFENDGIKESLINKYIFEYIQRKGLSNYDTLIPIYNKYVFKKSYKLKFQNMVKRWKAMEPGQISADFDCKDINGEKCSLSDFRGKYVYIDIWATWCGPCCAEIPYLENLEKKFKDKNIIFISYSCDRNLKKWRTKVLSDKMGGVQLNFSGDDSFMTAYNVTGIPRFILIDKNGKIINADMPRSSSSNTIKILEALKGL